GGVLDTGIDCLRVGQRRLQVPHPLELPGMRGAVVPLVRSRHAVILELVAYRFPAPAAVARMLDELAEPTTRLRGPDAVGVDRGALEVVDLPPREMGPLDLPVLARGVGGDHERPLAGSYQDADTGHEHLLSVVRRRDSRTIGRNPRVRECVDRCILFCHTSHGSTGDDAVAGTAAR